jgi:hypothetical protein
LKNTRRSKRVGKDCHGLGSERGSENEGSKDGCFEVAKELGGGVFGCTRNLIRRGRMKDSLSWGKIGEVM